ncbi:MULTISPECIES: DGQHR domain-containing protein DpdB [unclassified Variovorax]|uniref:DGQHR domain-containing protein DpdB n=1 Tax=unclassified Variovorax TaxID=663243 RepID=UPI000A947A64|nr:MULTISPECIES: DGQHR domain-containing protein DpdB [unclassified Variovorax]PNG50451.1 hypothetical protein CHC06_06075 [Variovorax sp. B2]PNG51324.1 hypothetical protein CHC07_05981 [Variovorax sp. B4]VTU43257.1 DGQHR domain protein [Variovorax sp. PBL-H6]VTU43341.1 DGQHR domain protein [Variovorax sp. SRS16]VTU43360.1 DGQHR domain protein [Variovorax sp. PBL-E5]
MQEIRLQGLLAQQSRRHKVLSVTALPGQLRAIARVERVGREEDGKLRGFQRHLVAKHIREISEYLQEGHAILPNPVVIAFVKGARVEQVAGKLHELVVTLRDGDGPGFVVDGQQRLEALVASGRTDFEVFCSVLICEDYAELRRQFVLINNTRPLPKQLVYELLPTVSSLPKRMSSRSFGSQVVEQLNYRADSSLRRAVSQHTNPKGVVRDTALQKLVMCSRSDGALREAPAETAVARSADLVSDFFWAVRDTWPCAWDEQTPRTSRLVHSAGIMALGFAMDYLHGVEGARTRQQFRAGLERIANECAWTHGSWRFSVDDVRPWNQVQNAGRDVSILANHLVRSLKETGRPRRRAARVGIQSALA